MRRLAAVSLALINVTLAVPLGLLAPAQPAIAQTGAQATWTQPYAAALEAQTDLVLQQEPLGSTLTRIELGRWLADLFQYQPQVGGEQPIADMTPNTPDYWTAQAMLQSGVMRAFEGNEFRPTGDLTKLEAIAIFVRALELPEPPQREIDLWANLYLDSNLLPEIGHTFVAMAGNVGLILNYPDPARLDPDLILSRGEGLAMLHQALVSLQRVSPRNPPVAQIVPDTSAQPEIAATQPEIAATRVLPETGSVRPGETLTIELQGTPGARGVASLAGRLDLPMREIQAGVYRATYTPTASDAILNPAIVFRLEHNGLSRRIQRQYPQLALGNVPSASSPIAGNAPPPLTANPSLPSNPIPTVPIPPQVRRPQLSAVRTTPSRDLRQGDIFTVQVQGEPGSNVRFDISGLVSNQPMREVQDGLYEGTYVVTAGDFAVNPSLQVVLVRNGLGVRHRELLPFAIDGSRANSATAFPTPAPASQAIPNATTPAAASLPPLIFNTTFSGVGRVLRANDILQVQLQGEQRAQASFRIFNVTPDIAMQEISPGMYQGQVRIERNTPAVQNGILQVTLQRNGLRTTRTTPDPVNINPL